MKIAFFTPNLHAGGYESVVVNYANEMAKLKGIEVYIVCGQEDGELKCQVQPNVTIYSLNCRARTMLKPLCLFLKEYRLDYIYVGFRVYNFLVVLAKYLAKQTQLKVCVSQHGYERNSRIANKIYGVVISKADIFLAVTKNVLQYEKEQLNLQCKQMCITNNPVIDMEQVENIDVNAWNANHETPVIVTCGRLSTDKNYELALEIMSALIKDGLKIKMLILGDGPEKEHLIELAEELGIIQYVVFKGFVKEPIAYMRNCSVYLHTCDKEGFGNTVVEALYAGLPIVTTSCGGPQSIIEDDKYGICFGEGRSKDSINRGALAIKYVLKHAEKYDSQRERALQFEKQQATKELLNILIGSC